MGAGSPAFADGELHVLNWQGYGTDEAWALKMFEDRTHLKVVHDYFNSEQEMLTKLRTSPGTYDVVLINNTFTEQAQKEGLIQPIDPSKISHFADLTPALRDSPRFNIGGKLYGLAWLWGVTSFAYNTETIKDRPDSIEVLWDPKYAGARRLARRCGRVRADGGARHRPGHEQSGRPRQGEGEAGRR